MTKAIVDLTTQADRVRVDRIIYLDHAATTPVDQRVATAMLQCLRSDDLKPCWANPASLHGLGLCARDAVEAARRQVAELIGAESREIVWTSGATESNNLAIKGAVEFNRSPTRAVHIITSRTEHKSVIDTCRYLETLGVRVTYLKPQTDGRICPEQVLDAICPETVLVSIMWVNNETGAIHDIPRLAPLLRERGILFHVDAVQAAGKLAIDMQSTPVDLLSISAHKVYGPKGIGALFVRRRPRARLTPQMHGGGHEQGMRSGTLAPHQIVGMGESFALSGKLLDEESPRLAMLREHLWSRLKSLSGVYRNGPDPCEPGSCAPHILNASFDGVNGEALRASIPELAVSSGSACSSATSEPSYVLRALGRSDALADASLRFSLGRTTTVDQIDIAAAGVIAAVRRLRELSPLQRS